MRSQVGRRPMIALDTRFNKDHNLRGASVMDEDLSKSGSVSGKTYREPLDDSLCFWGFEKTIKSI